MARAIAVTANFIYKLQIFKRCFRKLARSLNPSLHARLPSGDEGTNRGDPQNKKGEPNENRDGYH
ncbi:hypothetical protein AB4144_03135, partial [Rhizobiaceae sp. 2RAB30]